MPLMNQKRMGLLLPRIMEVLHEFGMSGSVNCHKDTTLVLTITAGPLDLVGNYSEMTGRTDAQGGFFRVSNFGLSKQFDDECLGFMMLLKVAMNRTPDGKLRNGYHSNPRKKTYEPDWYIEINVGHGPQKITYEKIGL